MKVTINNHVLTIGWNYESKKLQKAIKRSGLKPDDLKELTKKQICEKLGLKSFPLPEKTHCIISNTETGDRFVGTVSRWHEDPWNRDEARRRSLHKALWQLFPIGGVKYGHDEEQSKNRQLFWNVYNQRMRHDGKALLKKLLKKGLINHSDIAEIAGDTMVVSFGKQVH